MPLISGKKAKTKEGISENIRREKHAHPEMKNDQAVAIAFSQARRSKKKLKKSEGHCPGCTCGDSIEPLPAMIDEHKRLVAVLKSKSHKDDVKEAKVQEKELHNYEQKLKKE